MVGSACAQAVLAAGLLSVAGCETVPPSKATGGILAVFAPPTPAEAARWAADPYDADKRQRGLLLLANAPFGGEPAYLNLYLLRLNDEDPAVRAVALRALALHGGPDDAMAIAERLQTDPDPIVRREAARALQRIHNPAVVPALIQAVDDKREADVDTRAYAARALGQYAEPRVVQALIGALNERRLAVNENALDSLKVLTGENFGYVTRAWVAWAGSTKDMFAHRGDYVYPVFQRDPTIVEMLVPFWGPPNELPNQKPAGMPGDSSAGAPQKDSAASGDSGRGA